MERAILDRAEAAYVSLGQDADVASFLRWALARESYAFRESSRVIAALLGVDVSAATDDEPTKVDVPSLPALRRAQVTNASPSEEK
jgi:hypothetical protein